MPEIKVKGMSCAHCVAPIPPEDLDRVVKAAGFESAGASVQRFINTVTYFLLRENHFPLYLTLSPIGGEGVGEGGDI